RRHLPLTRCSPRLPPKYAWLALGVHVRERLSRLLCQSAPAFLAISHICLNQNTIRKLRSHNLWIAWITLRDQQRSSRVSSVRTVIGAPILASALGNGTAIRATRGRPRAETDRSPRRRPAPRQRQYTDGGWRTR